MGKLFGRLVKLTGWLMLLTMLGFCGLVTFGNAPFKAERDRERRLVASQMIEALEAHRAAKGAYPERLDGLVPDYVAALPDLVDRGSIDYRRTKEARGYRISYAEAPYGALPTDGFWIYESSKNDWTYVVY